MRVLILAPVLLLVAGCASTVTTNRYDTELQTLSQECTARGGILAPTGQQSGRPQLDNVCKITGGASRLTSGG